MAKKQQSAGNPYTDEHLQLMNQVMAAADQTRELLAKLHAAFGGLEQAIAENEQHYAIAAQLKKDFFPHVN